MNKNIEIPISGPSASENSRFPLKLIRKKNIQIAQRVNPTRNCNICAHFSVFVLIFITFLLLTFLRNQDKMDADTKKRFS